MLLVAAVSSSRALPLYLWQLLLLPLLRHLLLPLWQCLWCSRLQLVVATQASPAAVALTVLAATMSRARSGRRTF